MTSSEEKAVRAWLVHINETDAAEVDAVLAQCRTDADARRYFLKRAMEVRA